MDRRTALGAAAAALGLAVTGCDPGLARPAAPLGRASQSPSPAQRPSGPPALLPLPPEVVSGPSDRPNVALTFHGQGDARVVGQLLAALAEGGARVTVLAVGSWLDAEPAMARRILDGGHELGNHTQNHLAIATMIASKAFAEVNTCAQTLARLAGSIGTWFRPSQTQHSTAIIRTVAARVGYRTCLSYDVDSLDYTDPGPDAIVRNTLSSVGNGSIVSFHFGHAGTVAAIPRVLDGLHSRGLRPVAMTELMSI